MSTDNFDTLTAEIHAYFANKQFAEGFALASQKIQDYPDKYALISYWRLCFAAELGAMSQANEILEAVLASGIWYTEALLHSNPSLAALQSDREFERLAQISVGLQLSDPLEKLPLLVVRPEDACQPGTAPGCPVLFFFHDNYQNAHTHLAQWHFLSQQGWLLAMPQSSQAYWAGAYAWVKHPSTEEELFEKRAQMLKKYGLNQQRTVLAGWGAGADIALSLALNPRFRARGLILIDPVNPHLTTLSEPEITVEKSSATALKAWVLNSGPDGSAQWANAGLLVEALQQAGANVQLHHFSPEESGYPPDFEKHLESALTYIEG